MTTSLHLFRVQLRRHTPAGAAGICSSAVCRLLGRTPSSVPGRHHAVTTPRSPHRFSMQTATEPTSPERAPVRAFLREHRMALVASVVVTGGLFWVLQQGALPVLPNE